MIKVSVVIPIYKAEKYLCECLDSIVKQSLNDWECIMVNDGSPDNSRQICAEYVAKDKRFILINQENQGVSAARNNGLEKAKGEFVFFMDADDGINEQFLQSAYDNTIAEGSDLVICGKQFFLKEGKKTTLPAWAVLIRGKLLNEYPDVRFPIGIQPCEDGLFTHRLLALTDKISYNPEADYFYRQYPEQNHRQINSLCDKVLMQIPQWMRILESFYDEYGLWESKAAHLAGFMAEEPFGWRYLGMPFTPMQRQELFVIIKSFMATKIFPLLNNEEYEKLPFLFRMFLNSKSARDFDFKYKIYKLIKKCGKFLVRLVPVKKYRKKLRERYFK